MERGRLKKAIQGDLACESYPAGDKARRRFLKVAALGTSGVVRMQGTQRLCVRLLSQKRVY